ncbi:MAG: RNA-directed DNA polymerase, partial [Chloroflexi bacterium]|nr:RNA-directed DNA polymerase [Chloroflexota bacterium]
MENTKPTTRKMHPVPLSRRDQVEQEVQEYVKQGIWEPVNKSLWQHQLVTVPKPDGSPRITTDLSPLNLFVIPDRYPLPRIKELFLELRGACIFSKLDLRKGYFHVQLAEECRDYMMMITHQGLFRYKRLPMRLTDSGAVLQRPVAQTLAGVKGAVAYIDDILIYGATKEEHD